MFNEFVGYFGLILQRWGANFLSKQPGLVLLSPGELITTVELEDFPHHRQLASSSFIIQDNQKKTKNSFLSKESMELNCSSNKSPVLPAIGSIIIVKGTE